MGTELSIGCEDSSELHKTPLHILNHKMARGSTGAEDRPPHLSLYCFGSVSQFFKGAAPGEEHTGGLEMRERLVIDFQGDAAARFGGDGGGVPIIT